MHIVHFGDTKMNLTGIVVARQDARQSNAPIGAREGTPRNPPLHNDGGAACTPQAPMIVTDRGAGARRASTCRTTSGRDTKGPGQRIGIELSRHGNGRPLLFLHPHIGLDRKSPFIGHLAAHASVIAPSHPGFGHSEFAEVHDDGR